MPKLIIDNLAIEVPQGTKVIEAAEALGIIIPRFSLSSGSGITGGLPDVRGEIPEGPVKGVEMSCMVEAGEDMVVPPPTRKRSIFAAR